MENQEFKIRIDATREKVWSILWDDVTYRQWSSVFSEGSWAATDWQKGSKVLFLDDNYCGMVATIAEIIPNEFMSFKHLGTVDDGEEDTESEHVKEWAGALENHTLETVDGKTELTINIDVTEEFKDYFLNVWPEAMKKIKELAEKSPVLLPVV